MYVSIGMCVYMQAVASLFCVCEQAVTKSLHARTQLVQ